MRLEAGKKTLCRGECEGFVKEIPLSWSLGFGCGEMSREKRENTESTRLEVEETLSGGLAESRPRLSKAQVWAAPTKARSAGGAPMGSRHDGS